ncbi:MAG TPA: tetratricopeptide repeat protein [Streptosporangiaceae bacterium]
MFRTGPAHRPLDEGYAISELSVLVGLGYHLRSRGLADRAADCFERALRIARDLGDRQGELIALHSLGYTRRVTGHPSDAIAHHQAALGLARDLRQLSDQARALYGLAAAHSGLGRHRQAREHCSRLSISSPTWASSRPRRSTSTRSAPGSPPSPKSTANRRANARA